VVRHYPAGHVTPGHMHDWPQLLYASSGVMAVETDRGSWIVPSQRAVWVPPNCRHETRMLTEVSLASLYLRDAERWTFDCEVIEICPLLRELIIAALRIDFSYALSRRESLLIRLIVEELRSAPRGVSPIPMPAEQRLVRLCRRVIDQPSAHRSLEAHGRPLGLTPKTISRLFRRELGMSFRQWRQLVQTSYAVAHLIQGTPVKVVASQLGYSPSAFSVMLRRSTGKAPQTLRRTLAAAAGPLRFPLSPDGPDQARGQSMSSFGQMDSEAVTSRVKSR
jgi:AraC-like DNA-binding protein